MKAILNRVRGSARKRKLAIDIDLEFLQSLWEVQGGHCDVTGLAFSDERHEAAFVKTPFAPSLDRIDSSKGYLKDNVRLVSMAANFALNQWGDNVLRRLAYGVIETERKVHEGWYREQRRKLRKAEKAAQSMSGPELDWQKNIIAAYKAALTKGPARLGGAALKAHRTMRRHVVKSEN